MRMLIASIILLFLASLAAAVPIEQTPYGKAVFRIEARPGPQQLKDPAERQRIESALAEAGVDGRWISIVNPVGCPYLDNDYLPPVAGQDLAENEAIMKAWVAEMHAKGQAVMSWYALSIGQSANLAHPDWRQVSVVPWYREAEASFFCCHMTGYGDAMINYCIDAIKRLDLDGIWFDGAAWTPIWNRPLPITCYCDTCRATFKADTGLELPTIYDFSDPTFRTWVEWRYREFGEFIEKAARRIREACPDAAVVINHYHRPGIPWHSAIPVDHYDADIITGSEAFSPVTLDLTQRLNRAYGRSQSEVWRAFDIDATPELTAENLIPHALNSYVAGGLPSFGGDNSNPMMAQTATLMSPVMKAITPYVGAPSLPHIALHLSQQSETFVFARGGEIQNPSDFFWSALGNWTWALLEAHLPPDYIFDADFTQEKLAKYDVLLMPLSPALSGQQARTALDFARRGGVLVLGIGAGQKTPQGEPATARVLEHALGFSFTRQLDAANLHIEATRLEPVGEGQPFAINGVTTPADLTASEWEPLFLTKEGRPGIAQRPYGAGQVILVTADPSRMFGSSAASGGDTQLFVTDEQAATGKYSLKYIDGPIAAQTFYPDLENNLPAFGAPDSAGGLLECDLRLEEGARVTLEVRSHEQPILGPSVELTPDGFAHLSNGGTVPVPLGEWFHFALAYDFAGAGTTSTFKVIITRQDGSVAEATGASLQPDYSKTDWFVIFGSGTAPGSWYLDNLSLARRLPDGASERVLLLDFEEGENSLLETGALVTELADVLKRLAPPPIALEAPPSVHAGCFQPDESRVLVHLYSLDNALTDWLKPTGHAVRLSCAFQPASARLPLTGETLRVKRSGDRWLVEIPPIGLYQVVELIR